MSEPLPGLSLRIRPRSVPPGVGGSQTTESQAPIGAEAPPSAPAPSNFPTVSLDSIPKASSQLLSQGTSRPPVPVSFSRPPIPATSSPLPPSVPSAYKDPVEEPAAQEDLSKYKLRQAPSTASSPPQTKAPASTLAAAPQVVVPISPLLAPRARPEDSKLFQWGMKIFFGLGLLLAGCFAWLGWNFVQERYGEKPAKPSVPAASTPAKGTDESDGVANVPKKALDRAKLTVAQVEATRAENEVKEKARSTTKSASTAKGASTAPAPLASSIEDYAARIKVSGVAGGSKPRALIDGVMCYPGQLIEPRLGIVFESIDFGRHLLTFRDQNGAQATVKY